MGQDSSSCVSGRVFFDQCSGVWCDIALAHGQAWGEALTWCSGQHWRYGNHLSASWPRKILQLTLLFISTLTTVLSVWMTSPCPAGACLGFAKICSLTLSPWLKALKPFKACRCGSLQLAPISFPARGHPLFLDFWRMVGEGAPRSAREPSGFSPHKEQSQMENFFEVPPSYVWHSRSFSSPDCSLWTGGWFVLVGLLSVSRDFRWDGKMSPSGGRAVCRGPAQGTNQSFYFSDSFASCSARCPQ